MKKSFKRSIGLLLAMVMVLTMLPVTSMNVHADEEIGDLTKTVNPTITAPTELSGWYVGEFLHNSTEQYTKNSVDKFYITYHLNVATWSDEYQSKLENVMNWQNTSLTEYASGTVASDGTFSGGTDASGTYVAFFFCDKANLVKGAQWKIYIASQTGACTLTSENLYMQGTLGSGLTPDSSGTTYTITKASTSNGSFTVSAETAVKDTIITITPTPDSGFELNTVRVTDASGDSVSVTSDYKFTMPASNVTVAVTFKLKAYTVTFESNGGSTVSSIITGYDEIITKPTDPTKAGYTFDAWYKDEALTNAWDFSKDKVKEDITLYAKWIAKSTQTITASNMEVALGDTGKYVSATTSGDGTLSYAVKNGVHIVDVDAATGALTFKQAGPAMITITASETASYASATKDIEIIVFDDRQTYTISQAETANGSFTVSVTSAAKDTEVTITPTADIGYEVDTVSVKDASNNDISVTSDYKFTMPASNVTVSVTFKQTIYTVAFESNGGSAVDSVTTGYNQTIAKPTDPTKEGYTFDAWYKETALTNVWDFSSDKVTQNITLYAKWNENSPQTYTITKADTTNGSFTVSTDSAVAGTEVTITPAADTGYEVDAVSVIDANSNAVSVTSDYKFTMPVSNVTVSVSFKASSFGPTPPSGNDQPSNNNQPANSTPSTDQTTASSTPVIALSREEIDYLIAKALEIKGIVSGSADALISSTTKITMSTSIAGTTKYNSWGQLAFALPSISGDSLDSNSNGYLSIDLASAASKVIPAMVLNSLQESSISGMSVSITKENSVIFDAEADYSNYQDMSFAHASLPGYNSKLINFNQKKNIGACVSFATLVPKANTSVKVYEMVNGVKTEVATVASDENGRVSFPMKETALYLLEY